MEVNNAVFNKYIFKFLIFNLFPGAFSDAMSSQIFTHLNKLTYSMYMVSPIVITAAYGLKETSSHFDEADTVS